MALSRRLAAVSCALSLACLTIGHCGGTANAQAAEPRIVQGGATNPRGGPQELSLQISHAGAGPQPTGTPAPAVAGEEPADAAVATGASEQAPPPAAGLGAGGCGPAPAWLICRLSS